MTLAPQKNITKIISSVYNTYLLTNESFVYGIGYGAVFDYYFKFFRKEVWELGQLYLKQHSSPLTLFLTFSKLILFLLEFWPY
jgi:hypothetical protein